MKKKKEGPKLEGAALLKTVVNHILAHPESWNQKSWHCGTQHCIAGFGQIMGGFEQDDSTCSVDAANAYQLSPNEAAYLFSAYRGLCLKFTHSQKLIRLPGLIVTGLIVTGLIVPGLIVPGLIVPGLIVTGLIVTGLIVTGLIVPGLIVTGLIVTGLIVSGKN